MSVNSTTIDDGTTATLHTDRAGNEWIIVTSVDYPDYEGEVTKADDPPLFNMLKRMISDQD